jgi:hypothetical protein
VTYYNNGFTATFDLELDSAPDNNGVPGSWSAFSGTVLAGANPQTSTTNTYAILSGYNPWVSVILTAAGSSGTVNGTAYGCRIDNCAALFAASGGLTANVNLIEVGGASIALGQAPAANSIPVVLPSNSSLTGCTSQAETALSGTGYTQIVAGSGTKVIHVCNIAWTSAASNVPVVNTFAVAFGSCSGSPTQILSLPGITGYTDNFFGSLAGAAGAALCASESVSNSDNVTVTYAQY